MDYRSKCTAGGRDANCSIILSCCELKIIKLMCTFVCVSGNNVGAAVPALERVGAQGPFDPGYHGSYAFSGCTGPAPRFYTRAEVRPRYHGPAIVAQLIPTPAAQKGLFNNCILLCCKWYESCILLLI